MPEREFIRLEGVDLTNQGGTAGLILDHQNERRSSCYAECGPRGGLRSFNSKSNACIYVFSRPQRDPSAGSPLPVG